MRLVQMNAYLTELARCSLHDLTQKGMPASIGKRLTKCGNVEAIKKLAQNFEQATKRPEELERKLKDAELEQRRGKVRLPVSS
jgi:hypothetical protein